MRKSIMSQVDVVSEVFHLGLNRAMLKGATVAIIPGDPARSQRIAERMSNPQPLASHREFNSWLGELDGKPVAVCSTGIGGPSTSIAVEELAQLGIRTFLRVGTTGAIQPHINIGDLLITTGSVRLDGASYHFAPGAYPAVADFECTTALVAAAKTLGVKAHVGITASSDTFYPGQERYDTYSGRVNREWAGSMKEWQALHVMNYEMESATLLTMCSAMGLRAGMVAGVIVNRTQQETPDAAAALSAEADSVAVTIEAARLLLK
jgi:uridine phosphorylase